MGEMLDLFYEENSKILNFENGVGHFKHASRNLQYAYNLARSMHIHQGLSYHEAVEPIYSLVERFKDIADTLYQLRKTTASRHIRMLLEGFDSKYIASRLTDGEIVDLNSSPEKISRVMSDIAVNLKAAASSFNASIVGVKPLADYIIDTRNLVIREYVI
jgi:hypothetical protein